MSRTASAKTKSHVRVPSSRHRQVLSARGRDFILTFATGVFIGCLLGCLSFAYMPLFERHHQTRRLPVNYDPYTALLSNSSSDPWAEYNSSSEPSGRRRRVFCLVLTLTNRRRLDQIRAVRDTWAADCDGLMFITDRRLPRGFPSFVPALAAGANPVTSGRGQYGALKIALSYAPFSDEEFDFYLLAPDSVFVAMHNLREIVSRAAAGRPAAWGLVTRSYVPGEGRVAHLSGSAGFLLSDAARRLLVDSDCGWPRQAADAQLSLCLHQLGVPQQHVRGFHPIAPAKCATAPPPPPPRGVLQRLQRWTASRLWPRHWQPCPPRAVTFGGMNFATMRRTYFTMNLGLYGRTGQVDSSPAV